MDIFATGLGYLGLIFMGNPGFFQMLRFDISLVYRNKHIKKTQKTENTENLGEEIQ